MEIETLMSACKINNPKDVLKGKNIDKVIIVNQMMPNSIKKSKNVLMYSYDEKGLSKSRNRLLENMSGDIEIITDDDITFEKNYKKIIEKAYNDNPQADIITFNYCVGNYEIGEKKQFKYNSISILKVHSCQITFRKNSIINNNLKFDENFGIGSMFSSGEENIFLHDSIKKGLNIIHIPICLFYHPDENTTGKNWSKQEIITKGAVSYRIFKNKGYIYFIYMLVFKHKEYKNYFSILDFIKLFFNGRNECKKIMRGTK